jgi:septal ring factor EnvC (AmiA/AmiB activator)
MDGIAVISALVGMAGGAVSTWVALRRQRLDEFEAAKEAYLNHHQTALTELRELVEVQRAEIERLRRRVTELERADALKAEMIEDLGRLLERERQERQEERRQWQIERDRLCKEIKALRDVLEERKRWDQWER